MLLILMILILSSNPFCSPESKKEFQIPLKLISIFLKLTMDPDFVTSHRYSYCKFPTLGEGVVTSGDDNPSSASPEFYIINFFFTCQRKFFDYVASPDVVVPTQFVRQVDRPLLREIVRVCVRQRMCIDQTTSETIDEELEDWPLDDEDRPRFIKTAIEEAQRFLQSMPPHHNVLYIDFHVVAVQSNIYSSLTQYEQHLMEEESEEEEGESEDEVEMEEGEDEEDEEEMEEEESSGFMVPAMDSCPESLERKIIDGGCGRNIQNCTICLEEFPAASEVISMPCSHIFHGDCIQKWLRTSHYCPVCRFEMPTS